MFNKNKVFLAIVIFSLFSITLITGQENIKFENISVLDGLSNSVVQDIFQDSEGFMWFGTSDGLNKYDGNKFTIYRDDQLDPNSIKGNLIIKIYEDSDKNLWIGTEQGLNRYDRNNDNFICYQMDSSSTQMFFNGIVGIYEDSKKNLWIGKAYHGYTFFDKDSQKIRQFEIDTVVQSTTIFAIWDFLEDSNGEMWVTKGQNLNATNRLFKLNKTKTRETAIEDIIELNERQSAFSAKLYKSSNGNIWINTFQGISIEYNPNDKEFSFHDIGKDVIISSSIFDDTGKLWFSTIGKGLIKYDLQTKKSINYLPEAARKESIPSANFMDIFIDHAGIFWAGSIDNGVIKFDPFKEPLELYTISVGEGTNKQIARIISISDSKIDSNKVWIVSSNGLHTFDRNTKESTAAGKKLIPPLPDNLVIRSVVEDNSNNLWIGTLGNGIYRANLKNNRVQNIKADINNRSKLIDNNIYDFLEDSNSNVWIATQQGISKWIRDKDQFKRFQFLDTSYVPEIFDLFNSLFNSDKVLASITKVPNFADTSFAFTINETKNVLAFSIGEIFTIGTAALWDYGWIEDENGNKVWITDSVNNNHAGGAVKNRISAEILKLKPGKYTLRYKSDDSHAYGSWNAAAPLYPALWGIQLIELNIAEKNFLDKNLSRKIAGNSITGEFTRSLFEDSKGNIWIGSNNTGFSIYNPQDDSFKQFNSASSTVTVFNINRVNSFLEYSDGTIWIATFGGLVKFLPESNSFTIFTTKDGLPTNYIVDILTDSNNNIWLSTQQGLVQFDPNLNEKSISFISYDLKDGLQAYNYISGAALKLNDGKLLFGGDKGFNAFYPGNINAVPPSVVVTKLFLSNEVMTPKSENSPLKKAISQTSELNLSYNQNDLSFEFTALHYSRPDKNQYAHMLEGFDEQWIYDNRPFATYTNLDPGEYVFKVIASNSNGVWNDKGTSILITIHSPWWATTWAYLAYILFAAFLVFTLDKVQKRKIIAKEREKQKIQEAELRAIAAEAQSRLIQAENERKTKELEEARDLQLSMLPKVLPDLPHLDIAVYMKTATEVGGDYYDFHVSMDGTLTTVIGDATGHGLNAGTIVTITKSLFSSHASSPSILHTFQEISQCIKEMKFKYLSMCLMILKIKGNQLSLSAAGMPPALIFRRNNKVIEELLIKGMPLGAPASFPYEVKSTTLNTGDTILLMSDGFPELLSEKKEMFGYDNARLKFEEVAEKEPEEIINYLKDVGSNWVDGKDPDDDVTFVVIKVK
jgi:serine phosphatase RsbU (regulator of sigma subunit)/ligand-binding sensor domain-containing protein